jgi:hypothetical protein
MPVERYDPQRHYEDFKAWYAPRLDNPVGPEFLPRVGYVVPGVAMGFLYQTDSAVAHIEGLVANPKVGGEQRSAAIDEVVMAIIAEAKKLGFKTLHGQTELPVIVERAKRLGFWHDPTPQHSVTFVL